MSVKKIVNFDVQIYSSLLYLFKKIYSYDDYSLQILFFQLLEAFDFFSLVAKLIQISRA